jgi:hypothetical protein
MRILYLTANPQWVKRNEPLPANGDQPKNLRGLFKEYEKLDLWAELREVTDVLFDARAEGTVQLEVVPEVRRADVVRYVNARHPNVLHFSGHGEKQEIILNDKYGEDGELVSEEWLRGVLADKDIDVLVLNCCWSDTLAAALEDVVDLIIGTTVPLGGESAAEFSKTFYDALQNGVTLGQAFDAATKNVGEGLYRKTHRDPSILEKTFELQPEPAPQPAVQPAAGEEAAVTLTPAQQILNYQTRLGYMRDRLSANVLWDVGMIIIASQIAVIGFGVINGSYASYFQALADWGWWKESPAPAIFSAMAHMHTHIATWAPWLKWEPAVIMTALIGTPAARFASYLWIWLGSKAAARALTVVGTRPAPIIERELASGRIETMFQRLAEYEQ